jgi:hypothetical protein
MRLFDPRSVATASHKRRLRLIRQLRDARDLLDAWHASLRAVAVSSPNVGERGTNDRQPGEIAVLLAIVEEAKQGLESRLSELGAATVESPVVTKVKGVGSKKLSGKEISTLDLCLKACRTCGRALGAAFREAQLIADPASVRILYGAIRDFEKQLWVLDPRQAY